MKRILFIFCGLIMWLILPELFAGGDPRVNAAPAAFLGSEEITIYLRVVGTDLEDSEGPIFMVSGANGGALNQTLEATKYDDNVWTVTLIPDDYYGTPVGTIGGKVTDGGGKETNPFSISVFDPSAMDGVMMKWYPSTAIYSENVSIIFNSKLSDRDDLTDVEPIYMWAWNNPEGLGDAANQGSWGSIDPSAVCEKIGDNLWRKDIIPKVYWDTEKAMTEMGCLFRNMGGDKQTDDMTVPLSAPPVTEIAAVTRPFPTKFTKKDVFSLFYDLKLETNTEMKSVTDIYIQTSTNVEEENDPLPGNWIIYSLNDVARAKMTPVGDSIYFIQFIPEEYYDLNPDYELKQLNFIFRNRGALIKSEQYAIKVYKED